MLIKDYLNGKLNGQRLCDRVFEFCRKFMHKCDKFLLGLISNSEEIKKFQTDKRLIKLRPSKFLAIKIMTKIRMEKGILNSRFKKFIFRPRIKLKNTNPSHL